MIGVKKMQFLGLFLLQASVHYLKSQNRIRSSEKANKKRKKYTTSALLLPHRKIRETVGSCLAVRGLDELALGRLSGVGVPPLPGGRPGS